MSAIRFPLHLRAQNQISAPVQSNCPVQSKRPVKLSSQTVQSNYPVKASSPNISKTACHNCLVVYARYAHPLSPSLLNTQEEVMWVGEHSSHHLQFGSPYFLRFPTKLTSITNTAGGLEKAEYGSYVGAFETELEEFADMVATSTQRGSDISTAISDLRVLQAITRKIAEIEGLDFGGDLVR